MTYCAPCLADLALVREAVTSVSGTAACVAHAVLLTHPGDTPQRRLSRLTELRSMAEGKLLTASTEDVPGIELLIQEYALAGAMDMTVPLKDLAGDRTPRPPKSRRSRGRDRERGPRPEGERAPRPESDAEPTPSSELSASEGAPTPAEADSSASVELPRELSASEGAATPSDADTPAGRSEESAPVAE